MIICFLFCFIFGVMLLSSRYNIERFLCNIQMVKPMTMYRYFYEPAVFVQICYATESITSKPCCRVSFQCPCLFLGLFRGNQKWCYRHPGKNQMKRPKQGLLITGKQQITKKLHFFWTNWKRNSYDASLPLSADVFSLLSFEKKAGTQGRLFSSHLIVY